MWTAIILLANTIATLYTTFLAQRGNQKSRSTIIMGAVNQAVHQIGNMIDAGQLKAGQATPIYFEIINQILTSAQQGMALTTTEDVSARNTLNTMLAAKAKIA